MPMPNPPFPARPTSTGAVAGARRGRSRRQVVEGKQPAARRAVLAVATYPRDPGSGDDGHRLCRKRLEDRIYEATPGTLAALVDERRDLDRC